MKKEEREKQLFIYGVIACFVVWIIALVLCMTAPCCF